MKIYFIRHGFAKHNELYQKLGEKAYFDKSVEDAELTEIGILQAIDAGKVLNDIEFAEYYSSPLIRCIQTMDNAINKDIIINLDDRLMESQGFHISNKRKSKYILEQNIKSICSKNSDLSKIKEKYNFDFELNIEINNRIINFINEIKSKYKNTNKNILVCTHYDWLNHFFKIYLNQNVGFKNCEIKIVEF